MGRKLMFITLSLALAVALSAAGTVILKDKAVLAANNGYRYETTFTAEEAFRITITLKPQTVPCDALLYPKDKDTALDSASGRGVLHLRSSRGGRFTLAVVGGSRQKVNITILARTNGD